VLARSLLAVGSLQKLQATSSALPDPRISRRVGRRVRRRSCSALGRGASEAAAARSWPVRRRSGSADRRQRYPPRCRWRVGRPWAAARVNVSTDASGGRYRADTRTVVERGLGSFEGIGAAIWAERAHTELDSLVVQRPHGGLTTAEPRVAELAAARLSNKGDCRQAAHRCAHRGSAPVTCLRQARHSLRAQLPGWLGTADRPRVEVFRFAHGPRRVTVVKR
jgi:hypothetical protein